MLRKRKEKQRIITDNKSLTDPQCVSIIKKEEEKTEKKKRKADVKLQSTVNT